MRGGGGVVAARKGWAMARRATTDVAVAGGGSENSLFSRALVCPLLLRRALPLCTDSPSEGEAFGRRLAWSKEARLRV